MEGGGRCHNTVECLGGPAPIPGVLSQAASAGGTAGPDSSLRAEIGIAVHSFGLCYARCWAVPCAVPCAVILGEVQGADVFMC